MRIGGFQKISSIDWEGQLCAVIFCQGCPWRCSYCHNPHLLPAKGVTEYTWDTVETFLKKRQGLLDGVVFSGGEPTVHKDLLEKVKIVKELGFRIALHTAGIYPHRLKPLLPYLDWVGLDIKAPWSKYPAIIGTPSSGEKARESLNVLLESKTPFECRTTVHWDLLSPSDLLEIARELARLGVQSYSIQAFRSVPRATLTTCSSVLAHQYKGLWESIRKLFPSFTLRNGAESHYNMPHDSLHTA